MNYDQHSKSCLARAIISCIENWRDAPLSAVSQLEFRLAAQDNTFLTEADYYLADGTVPCRCHVAAIKQVMERYALEGAIPAQSLAEAHLKNLTITPECYIQLVRWSEGRKSAFDHGFIGGSGE